MGSLSSYRDDDATAGEWACDIISKINRPLHDQIRQTSWAEDSELARLTYALPDRPLSVSGTVMAGMDAATGALEHIARILAGPPPHPTPALHPLLRTALVGAARAATALLPTDPDVRLTNAAAVLWRDADGFRPALSAMSKFKQLQALKPPADLVDAAAEQRTALVAAGGKIPEGILVDRMIQSVANAVTTARPGDDHQTLREHASWMWNLYSGAAHANFWPRIIEPFYGDGNAITGNYLGDLFQVSVATEVGLYAVLDRARPGTAGATSPVDMTPHDGA